MPEKNTIVAMVDRIEPGIEKAGAADLLRKSPDGVSIIFEGDQIARLFPGGIAVGMLEILEELRKMQAPVYVEVNPENKEITRLLIPLVTRVTAVAEGKAEEISVQLEVSCARQLLKSKSPDFRELLATLRAAQEKNEWLIVTETDDHEIIDVRICLHKPKLPEGGPPPDLGKGLLARLYWWCCKWFCRWFCCFCRYSRCVSPHKANEIFYLVSTTTCDPLTVPPPCIPFLYPDDGCWARAHEMCRLMIAAGVQPRKVWIDGSLVTPTRNHPNCEVHWGWHVAPTICVRRRLCRIEDVVIDPSLFTSPVSKATWKGAQGDINAALTDSDASLYWRNVMPTDPGYADTNFRLNFYRQRLKNRSLMPAGPPPYAHCP